MAGTSGVSVGREVFPLLSADELCRIRTTGFIDEVVVSKAMLPSTRARSSDVRPEPGAEGTRTNGGAGRSPSDASGSVPSETLAMFTTCLDTLGSAAPTAWLARFVELAPRAQARPVPLLVSVKESNTLNTSVGAPPLAPVLTSSAFCMAATVGPE